MDLGGSDGLDFREAIAIVLGEAIAPRRFAPADPHGFDVPRV